MLEVVDGFLLYLYGLIIDEVFLYDGYDGEMFFLFDLMKFVFILLLFGVRLRIGFILFLFFDLLRLILLVLFWYW